MPSRNAIHGLVRWAAWTAAERDPHRVLMTHIVDPQPGYPFSLSWPSSRCPRAAGPAHARRQRSDRDCPTALAPTLTWPRRPVDPLELRIPAAAMLHSDDRGLPTGSAPVAGTDYASAGRGRSAGWCWTTRRRAGARRRRAGADRAARPGVRSGPTLWMDEAYPYVMVFSGDRCPTSPAARWRSNRCPARPTPFAPAMVWCGSRRASRTPARGASPARSQRPDLDARLTLVQAQAGAGVVRSA